MVIILWGHCRVCDHIVCMATKWKFVFPFIGIRRSHCLSDHRISALSLSAFLSLGIKYLHSCPFFCICMAVLSLSFHQEKLEAFAPHPIYTSQIIVSYEHSVLCAILESWNWWLAGSWKMKRKKKVIHMHKE